MMQGAGSATPYGSGPVCERVALHMARQWAFDHGPTRGCVCLCEVTQADLWIAEMAELMEKNQEEMRQHQEAIRAAAIDAAVTGIGIYVVEPIDLRDPDEMRPRPKNLDGNGVFAPKLDGLEYATSPYVAPGSKTMEAPAGWTRVLTCGPHEILEACELPYSTHGFTEVSLYLDERGNVRAIVGNP